MVPPSRRRAHAACASAIAAAALAIPGIAPARPATAQELTDPTLLAETVAEGLGVGAQRLTVGMVFLDPDTALIVNRYDGVVRRLDLVDGSVVTPGPVVADLNIVAPTKGDAQTEYGVQGFTLHPDFPTNGWVYLRYDLSPTPGVDTPQSDVVFQQQNFSASEPTPNVIDRFVWNPDVNGGDGALQFDERIHEVTVDSRYHHGGPIRFGPDGRLHAIYGDLRRDAPGGWRDDTAGPLFSVNNPAGVVEDHGTIVRLNDDGTVPAENPFNVDHPDVPERAKTWFAYGVRNSFGLAFDPATGNLWCTINGEALFDEINRVPPGANGGWRWLAGPLDHPFQPGDPDDLLVLPGSTYVDPAFAWLDSNGVTGIHVLHGSALGPAYDDRVLVGMIPTGNLWGFRLNAARDGFRFEHPGLQDRVDDRENAGGDPVGTEAEELLFGRDFGGPFAGVLLIERDTENVPYVLTAQGNLVRLRPRALAPLLDATVTWGTLLSGGVDELVAVDGETLRARSRVGFTAFEPNVIELRVGAQAATADPDVLAVAVVSSINHPAGVGTARARDWTAGAFLALGEHALSPDPARAVFGAQNGGRFVRAGDRRVEIALRHVVAATFSAVGFESFFDLVETRAE